MPKLLEVLDLESCMVPLDAMGCQQKSAAVIRTHRADSVLWLTDTPLVVQQEVEEVFDDCLTHDPASFAFDEQVDGGHGRVEVRRLWSSGNLEWCADLDKWQDLRNLGLVESERHMGAQGSVERRLDLRSLPANDPAVLPRAIRVYWGLENGRHRVLAVAMREDESRVRKDHAGEKQALLHKRTRNVRKQDPSVRGGIHAQRLRAGWDTDYLVRLLG